MTASKVKILDSAGKEIVVEAAPESGRYYDGAGVPRQLNIGEAIPPGWTHEDKFDGVPGNESPILNPDGHVAEGAKSAGGGTGDVPDYELSKTKLAKLDRPQLDAVGEHFAIADAADTEKFSSKADLVDAIVEARDAQS